MADGVRPRPHGPGGRVTATRGTSHAILASSALARSHAAGGLSAVARAGRRSCRLVQLLLMPEQQVTAGEASRTFRALKGLLLGVRALVPLQVLQAGKGALASRADVWPRLVSLWWREVGRRLRVDGDCGRCRQGSKLSAQVEEKKGAPHDEGKFGRRTTDDEMRIIRGRGGARTGGAVPERHEAAKQGAVGPQGAHQSRPCWAGSQQRRQQRQAPSSA